MTRLSDAEKAWIACAIDSEGCISQSNSGGKGKSRLQTEISIANTDKRFIDEARRIAQFGNVGLKKRSKNPAHKDLYGLKLHGNQACAALLKTILPFLIIKKDKALMKIELAERTFNGRGGHRITKVRY